jgi:hypothetical protein
LNGIATGCRYCVKGEKLVLFISGKCSRNCWYCSLSNKRKNIDKIWANEREIKNTRELIEEVKESNSKGMGITGGDPLLFIDRTIKFCKIAKKKLGKGFHIHIYLPTKLVDEEKLKESRKYIDEVRLHPEFLITGDKNKEEDIAKIILTSKIFGKQNTGIELPLIPEKRREILDFILQVEEFIEFINLNELELSDTNYNQVTRKYKLKEGGYVIARSKEAGLWILDGLKKRKTRLKVHLCTADLKNNFQYKNRLKRHKIMKYGKKTEDGTVIYFVADKKLKNRLRNNAYLDKRKSRLIINPLAVNRLMKDKIKIMRVEEYPTYDRYEAESELIRASE